ncbi:hypothetical protein AM501_00785 [Aneurinibacillus migulanus]|nr:hypothetical protein AM501_00785 [Aneurinibacillus migulanus]
MVSLSLKKVQFFLTQYEEASPKVQENQFENGIDNKNMFKFRLLGQSTVQNIKKYCCLLSKEGLREKQVVFPKNNRASLL